MIWRPLIKQQCCITKVVRNNDGWVPTEVIINERVVAIFIKARERPDMEMTGQ